MLSFKNSLIFLVIIMVKIRLLKNSFVHLLNKIRNYLLSKIKPQKITDQIYIYFTMVCLKIIQILSTCIEEKQSSLSDTVYWDRINGREFESRQ